MVTRVAASILLTSEFQGVKRTLDRSVPNRMDMDLKPQAIELCCQRFQDFRLQIQPASFARFHQVGLEQCGGPRFDDAVLKNLNGGRFQSFASILLTPFDELRYLRRVLGRIDSHGGYRAYRQLVRSVEFVKGIQMRFTHRSLLN